MTIYELIAEGTMSATVKHLHAQNEQNIDADKLTDALRSTLKADIPEMIAEVEAMGMAMMTEQQLKWALNVKCNALAAKAISAYRA